MEFPEYLDTRDLENLADKALEDARYTDEDDYDEEKLVAGQETLDAMKTALKDFGYDMEDEEVSWGWSQVGDNLHVTLVREDVIGEYWEEKTEEYGILTKDQLKFLEGSVNWDHLAKKQEGVRGTFGTHAGAVSYYIY